MKLWEFSFVQALIWYGVLWVLFLIPFTGLFLMFAMALAGPIWGLLPHLIIVAFIKDIFSNRLPRAFLIAPILIYGAYYVYYVSEEIQVLTVAADLQKANPKSIVEYDPNKHILLTQDQGDLGRYYKIPVIYDKNPHFPEGALSYRVASPKLCGEARNLQIEYMSPTYFSWMEFKDVSGRDYYFSPNVCQITSAEKIPVNKSVLNVVRTEEGSASKENKGKLIYKTTYDFYTNDIKSGTFIAARRSQLTLFPLFLAGCGFNSSPAAWICFADFYRKPTPLNTYPDGINVDPRRVNPIAIMLGLQKYEETDLKDFSDFPETVKYMNALLEKKRNEKPEDFNVWGIRKDSLYMPKIGKKDTADSFEGIVASGDKGGEFYSFIKNHEGQIVYLDIDARSNQRLDSFTNYGVCKLRENCTGRTDDSYQFFNKDGTRHPFLEEGKFKGFFQVGRAELFEGQYNMGDNDTITKLIFISSDSLVDGVK